jgi:hypothetical protein
MQLIHILTILFTIAFAFASYFLPHSILAKYHTFHHYLFVIVIGLILTFMIMIFLHMHRGRNESNAEYRTKLETHIKWFLIVLIFFILGIYAIKREKGFSNKKLAGRERFFLTADAIGSLF